MKKQVEQCSIESTTAEDQLQSLLESYNFEKLEYTKIICDASVGFGWLLLAIYTVHTLKKWLLRRD